MAQPLNHMSGWINDAGWKAGLKGKRAVWVENMSMPLDALDRVAPLLKVRPELQDYCRFGGNWRVPQPGPGSGWAGFHIVTKGECEVQRSGARPVALTAGDVLLLPHGDEHVVYGGHGAGPLQKIDTIHGEHIRFRQAAGVAVETELVCGRFHFENATENLLFHALPNVILLKLDGVRRYSDLIAIIRDELNDGKAGAASIAADLASGLFVMALRQHMEAEAPATGLLALLVARETARAAAAMTKEPSRNWTLEELASLAAVSKPTLVRAFRRLSGLPPLAFLTDLRLALAKNRIIHTSDPMSRIAGDVGYQTEAALSRAMLRRYSVRPGALRRSSAFV